MPDSLTLPNPTAALASAAAGRLLPHLQAELPWLTDRYGLVQTGIDKKSRERYPQVYRNDGSRFVTDIRPEEAMGALSWLEFDGPTLVDYDDALQVSGTYTFQLAAVVWCNLKRLDPLRGYDFTELLAEDYLRALGSSPFGPLLTPERIEQQVERVFERYRWEPATHQLLVYPFSGFRIPFTLRQTFVRGCAAGFAPLSA